MERLNFGGWILTLNQKIQNPNPDELMIEVDLCYELDPYELKLDEDDRGRTGTRDD